MESQPRFEVNLTMKAIRVWKLDSVETFAEQPQNSIDADLGK